MKQKVILAVLAVLFFALLVLGLVLSITQKDDKEPALTTTVETTPVETTPVETSPVETSPVETTPVQTTPVETTPVVTTPTATAPVPSTPAATAPAPTTPQHTHAYVGTVTAPTLTAEGYTVYKCTCGHSYVSDKTPVLTLAQHVDQLPLRPGITGINALDGKAQSVLSSGSGTYGKLQAVHSFLRSCSHGPADATLSQMSAFAGKKVFKNISELKFAYDANQVFTNKVGKAEHFAAAYAVAARNLGLESYVVSGSYNGAAHTWCQIYLGEQMYIFDGYNDTFAKLSSEAPGYTGGSINGQSGFQSAGEYTITLNISSDGGSTTRKYTWSVDKAGSGNDDFLQNAIDMKLSGKVEYTVTVTAKNGTVVIYDHTGMPNAADSFTGKLNPAAGKYTLLVEEQASGRSFLITIDN